MKNRCSLNQFLSLLAILLFIGYIPGASQEAADIAKNDQISNDSILAQSTDFQIMQMSAKKLDSMLNSPGDTLRRIYFQFQFTSPSKVTVLSYAWCKNRGEPVPARFCDSMFLDSSIGQPQHLDPPYAFANLEWRRPDIKDFIKDAKSVDSLLTNTTILFVPYIKDDNQNDINLIPVAITLVNRSDFFENGNLKINKINAYVKANAASSTINPCPPKKPDTEN